LRMHAKNLEFDPAAFEDLAWWIKQDRKKALRIMNLIKEVQRTPSRAWANPNPSSVIFQDAGQGGSTMNTAWSTRCLMIRSEFLPVDTTTNPNTKTCQKR